MNYLNPEIRKWILKRTSHPKTVTVLLICILVLVSFITWYWSNNYLDRYYRSEVKNLYYQPMAEMANGIEKEARAKFNFLDMLSVNINNGKYSEPTSRRDTFSNDIRSITENSFL